MPINTTHDQYDEAVKKATIARDFFDGEYRVKQKGDKYLPRPNGQNDRQFAAYIKRAHLTPAVKPTLSAMIGSIMRKKPVVEADELFINNIDGNGQNLTQFTSEMIKCLGLDGVAGYLVDLDDRGSAQIKKYTVKNIINYSDDYIVLAQGYKVKDSKDPYIQHSMIEYIELTFIDGAYVQRVWREQNKKMVIVSEVMPTNRGEPLREIPFVFVSNNGLMFNFSDPALLDLALVNEDEYRLSTDRRHGLHWTALPTGFLFGEITDDEGLPVNITLGAGSFNQIPDTAARAELLEFTGAGLAAVKEAVEDSKKTMAALGAKLLTDTTKVNKSTETTMLEAGGETATLSTIADVCELAINRLFSIINEWTGQAQSFAINRDFMNTRLNPQELVALLQTWQSGGMSLNTFLYQLEKGELLPSGIDAEQEESRIGQNPTGFIDG